MGKPNEIARALRRLSVETGSLACLGCGHEHNCSIHGCAILRNAADMIARLNDFDQSQSKIALERCQKAEAQPANEPLTMEQLKQMDGEPVWIKDGIGAGWFLVGGSDGKTLYFYEKSIQVGEPMPDYGKTWLAYDHKPGGEHDGD